MSEYMALYRKYRPTVFSDVVGQDHITKVLRSEISQGTASHAYLFCGSRGTGKTTCAKILAKAISCENPKNGDPCGKCERCRSFESSFDIVEMDAASNNGVDDVRELREKINFMPIEMKKRVYIIDEVHMLSIGAFNALLKTLEEPPEHVMFILATTELNKIPATILSRCKRFDFHRIGTDDIVGRLEYIAEKEEIGIEKDALRLIATLATGAMRDALSMLELFVGAKNVTRSVAEKSLGVVGNEVVLKLLRCIADKNSSLALETVSSAYNSSKDPALLCSELGEMLRSLLVMKYASTSVSSLIDEGEDVIAVLRDIEDKFTPERLLYCTEIVEAATAKLSRNGLSRKAILEIMIMRLCDSRLSTSPEALLDRISALEAGGASVKTMPTALPTKADSVTSVKEDAPPFDIDEAPMPTQAPAANDGYVPETPKPLGSDTPRIEESTGDEMIAYGDILEEIKARNVMLYSWVSDSRGYLDGDIVTVKVSPMAVFMINADEGYKNTIAECAGKVLGYSVKVKVTELDDNKHQTKAFPEF